MTSTAVYLQVCQTPDLEELYCFHWKTKVDVIDKTHITMYNLTYFLWCQVWILLVSVTMFPASRRHSRCPSLRQRRFCSSCSDGAWTPWGFCSSVSPRWRCRGRLLRLLQLFLSMTMILNYVVKVILNKHFLFKYR